MLKFRGTIEEAIERLESELDQHEPQILAARHQVATAQHQIETLTEQVNVLTQQLDTFQTHQQEIDIQHEKTLFVAQSSMLHAVSIRERAESELERLQGLGAYRAVVSRRSLVPSMPRFGAERSRLGVWRPVSGVHVGPVRIPVSRWPPVSSLETSTSSKQKKRIIGRSGRKIRVSSHMRMVHVFVKMVFISFSSFFKEGVIHGLELWYHNACVVDLILSLVI